ncbi:MAG: hypothetical protein AB8B52_10410 [Winogradskyella sp.]|uniref:hypothetical protein n=1 Tax=Winogradskyella sp. TaxID=1883156 RepID=UPI00385F4D6A
MFKKQNIVITINAILLLIGLYTYIELYNPSLLKFTDEPYVPKGGDYLTEGLFTALIHYVNLFAFYTFNIIWMIRGFIYKKYRNSIISFIAILIMLSIGFWMNKNTSYEAEQLKVEEVQ